MDLNEQIVAGGLEMLRELDERQNPYATEWLRKVEAEGSTLQRLVQISDMKIALMQERSKNGSNFALDEALAEMFGI